jgi:hypothetical protein
VVGVEEEPGQRVFFPFCFSQRMQAHRSEEREGWRESARWGVCECVREGETKTPIGTLG